MGENDYSELDEDKLRMMREDQEAMKVFMKMNNGVRERNLRDNAIRNHEAERAAAMQDLQREKERLSYGLANTSGISRNTGKSGAVRFGGGIFEQMKQVNVVKYEKLDNEELKKVLHTLSSSIVGLGHVNKSIENDVEKAIKEMINKEFEQREETLEELIPQLNYNLVEDILNIEAERNNQSKNL